jgi:pimeloyl-ACP methyl ester carboxylesterase
MSDPTKTIVLIHGLWMTPRSWEKWIGRYESRGHRVLAPAWPGMEATVEELNRDPTPMRKLDIATIVDHYDSIIRELDEAPIIMGHSFGGAFTQLLLDRGLGAAGVGVAPAAVKGVLDLPLSTLRATSPALRNPFNRGGATGLSPRQFHYAFANTLSREESDAVRARYHVPGANRVLWQGAFANLNPHAPTKVDFANDRRAPLLFIAFGRDHIIPPKVARHNAAKYGKSSAMTAYKEFPDRPHFPGVAGWEEVADYALAWALNPTTYGDGQAVAQDSPPHAAAASGR